VWDFVRGQDRAVALLRTAATQPVHAYLFVGPEGCGKEEAARTFAGVLLANNDDPTDRANDLAQRRAHPDIHLVVREGASIIKDQSEEVVRLASVTPTEGNRKVIIMHEINLMQPAAIVRLLKTLEEPPPGVFFVLLADQVDDTLATIVSTTVPIIATTVPTLATTVAPTVTPSVTP
jgi:DNA polymerase-3 subunit delta'